MQSFVFLEFARAFGEGAWRLLARIARKFEDGEVNCCVIDPDPFAYYQVEFGEAADFTFDVSDSVERYTRQMHEWPTQSSADAVAFRADVVAWHGGSQMWGWWGERESGLVVIAFRESSSFMRELLVDPELDTPLFTLDEALDEIAANELSKAEFTTFSKRMREVFV